jgi:hypothetical protein
MLIGATYSPEIAKMSASRKRTKAADSTAGDELCPREIRKGARR